MGGKKPEETSSPGFRKGSKLHFEGPGIKSHQPE